MRRIRVLIVDDSVVVRRILTEILSADPLVEVVGVAATGSIALQKIVQLSPDLVTLDVEMPEMSGLETLVELRKAHPRLPVIMFSALTERAAAITLDALARGATDYVTKPRNTGSREGAVEHVREQLLPKIRMLGTAALEDERPPAVPLPWKPPPVAARATSLASAPVDVLAIGASTGGPNALAAIFAHLPRSLPVPIVLVQHMPPVFTKLFADRMTDSCPMAFLEAQGGETLEAGHVYIAPGGHHLRIVREGVTVRTVIDDGPPESSCRPAVDVLFRSTADVYGAGMLALILTGMGQDGLRGCEMVRQYGGQVIVQDEASSVVWGMPGFVAQAGLADAVLSLSDIPGELLRRIGTGSRRAAASSTAGAPCR